MLQPEVLTESEKTLSLLRSAGLRLAVAESCTGGLLAASLTAIAGSSDVFERGWVTYSNEAKQDCLSVPAQTIIAHGAVSEQTALAMAAGILAHCPADLALSITGIAGPGGATPQKPVGTVWLGFARRGAPPIAELQNFSGTRTEIRATAVQRALQIIQNRFFDSAVKKI